ncbi:MAG: hypothetical protein HYU59_04930 [Magnetospirillum gryphiswaldense]|nr:hypothetical protein [Magnetospirillum gryphiswaldense]
MSACSIDPALATLALLGCRGAVAEGLGAVFLDRKLTDLAPGLWRLDTAIKVPVPAIEAPPHPSGPCAAWLMVEPLDRPAADHELPWRLVTVDASDRYGKWGGIPPDIQIASSDFLTAWKQWRLRYLAAKRDHEFWETCETARRWVVEVPGRSLWLKLGSGGADGGRQMMVHLTPTVDETGLTLTPAAYAIEQPDCGAHADGGGLIKRHALGELAHGGGDLVPMGIIGREALALTLPALLMDKALTLASRGLEHGSTALRALNDPVLMAGSPGGPIEFEAACGHMGDGAPWRFMASDRPGDLIAAALFSRAEAGERILCLVSDHTALAELARATASWLPSSALASSSPLETRSGVFVSSSILEAELRLVEDRLTILAASSEDRARTCAEGPFMGEAAAKERMAKLLSCAPDTLAAGLYGIDWRRDMPISAEEARRLGDLLVSAPPDCPDRGLPASAIIPPYEVVRKIADGSMKDGHARWLVEVLLDLGPLAGDAIGPAQRLVERLAVAQAAVDGAQCDLSEGTVTAVFHHLGYRLRELSARTLAATGRLIDYARRVNGRTIVVADGTDLTALSDAAKRHHRALANPAPTAWWARRRAETDRPHILGSVTLDGMSCNSVDDFRTLVEWTELQMASKRVGIPDLQTEWRENLKSATSLGAFLGIAEMHGLASLVVGYVELGAGFDEAERVFGVNFPQDLMRTQSAIWISILVAFISAPEEWGVLSVAARSLSSDGLKGDRLADALASALRALDTEVVERLRGELDSYHRTRANLVLRDTMVERIAVCAPLLASQLRDGEPAALAALADLPQQWDLARGRAWQEDSIAAECFAADAELAALECRHTDLIDEIRQARLRESLAEEDTDHRVLVALASDTGRRPSLYNEQFDLLIFWTSSSFPPALYAASGLADRVTVVGGGVEKATDVGDDPVATITGLRERGGVFSLLTGSGG